MEKINEENKNNKDKVIVVMYRTLGIRRGRGYQPINIFTSLERENLIKKMYVFRITDKKYKNNQKIGTQPSFWLGLMYISNKIERYLGRKSGGDYLYYKNFFDKFI